MITGDKLMNDDHYVNNLLLKIANNGEHSGKHVKIWCKKNWVLLSSVVTVCVMAPIYFIWGFKKSNINNF